MGVIWGLVVLALSLLAWLGQAVAWLWPAIAERFALIESEDTVDPAFYADIRGEAVWDTLVLWTMAVSGALLVAGNPNWAYFGLIGGGMYVYFAGRGIVTRVSLYGRGVRVGTTRSVSTALVMLSIWGVMALITVIAAVVALPAA